MCISWMWYKQIKCSYCWTYGGVSLCLLWGSHHINTVTVHL